MQRDRRTLAELADLDPAAAHAIPMAVWRDAVDLADDQTVAAFPVVVLQLARAYEPGQRLGPRTAALDRFESLTVAPQLHRELLAERAIDRARTADLDAAELLAREVLANAAADEPVAIARATDALGRVLAWRGDEISARAADRMLIEAAEQYDALGTTEWAGFIRHWRGNAVCYQHGDLAGAEVAMREGLAQLDEHSPRRGVALTFLADVLTMRGEWDQVEAILSEAAALAVEHGDSTTRAYVAWSRAKVASLRGDAAATERYLHQTEQATDDWFHIGTGSTYLADAAELLDRVGRFADSDEYLRRALDRDRHDEFVMQARATILARRGDPAVALEELQALTRAPWLEPRLTWRRTMFAAYATLRAGRSGAGGLAARALEQAAALGAANIALVGEPALTTALLPLAAHAGSATAESLLVPAGGVLVRSLGEFSVRRDGADVELSTGQPAAVIRLLSLHPAGLDAEEIIDTFWPEDDPDAGRRRLRGALSRLRSRSGDLVIRHGSRVTLAPGWVDARAFREAADAALAHRSEESESLALAALALWTGELLPGDPYESWAVAPREQLRRRRLALLDLIAATAAQRGSLDEARLALEQAIEADPYDETRYLTAARHLLALGRRAPARQLLDRATAVLTELGLPPTAEVIAALNEITTAP